jgi:hypothetical protein
MKHLVVALSLVAFAGCKKKENKAEPAVASGSAVVEPAGSAGSANGSGSAVAAGSDSGSNAGSAGAAPSDELASQPFPRFDDSLTGKSPWITDAEAKAGIVEMLVDEDLSGKTKGVQTVKRHCGAAAKKAAEQIGAAFVKRSKDATYEKPVCDFGKDTQDKMYCLSMGQGEGDVALIAEYTKTGETWALVGVQSVGVGIHTDKLDPTYDKLLAEKCK